MPMGDGQGAKGAERVECREGVPSPGRGVRGWGCAPPRKILQWKMVHFAAFCMLFCRLQ